MRANIITKFFKFKFFFVGKILFEPKPMDLNHKTNELGMLFSIDKFCRNWQQVEITIFLTYIVNS